MVNIKPIVWEEVKDLKLSSIKTVEEMIPRAAENQLNQKKPNIWEEQYAIIEEVLKMDGTVEEGCILAGISVPAYYKHIKKNPDFARRIMLAKQFPKLIARAAVQKRIRLWDAKTALRFLELRDKKRYNDEINMHDIDEWENRQQVVEFISVATNKWQKNTTARDYQTPTGQNYVSDWSVNLSDSTIQTPWENDEQVLRNIDSLSSNNG